jgi:single-strand DNA-binding protein
MTNDTMVTVQGWLGNEPQLREVAGTSVANFRVGCTPRRFNRARQEWSDAPTQWYGVSAWRLLGEHCKRSLHVGDPVIVHGRLNQRSYVRDGVEVTVLEIDAVTVGHDLTRGTASFSKTVGSSRSDRPQESTGASTTVDDPWAVPASGSSEVAEVAEVAAGAA